MKPNKMVIEDKLLMIKPMDLIDYRDLIKDKSYGEITDGVKPGRLKTIRSTKSLQQDNLSKLTDRYVKLINRNKKKG